MSTTPRRVPIWSTGELQSSVDLQIRKLCIAVLESAIDDMRVRSWTKPSRSANTANPDLERDWIASYDVRPMSFSWICQVLDLDADAVRNQLLSPDWRLYAGTPGPSVAPGESD